MQNNGKPDELHPYLSTIVNEVFCYRDVDTIHRCIKEHQEHDRGK